MASRKILANSADGFEDKNLWMELQDHAAAKHGEIDEFNNGSRGARPEAEPFSLEHKKLNAHTLNPRYLSAMPHNRDSREDPRFR